MSANLYAVSDNWDHCGSPRTVGDDLVERAVDEIRDDDNRLGPIAADAINEEPGLLDLLRSERDDAEFMKRFRAAIEDRVLDEARGEVRRYG